MPGYRRKKTRNKSQRQRGRFRLVLALIALAVILLVIVGVSNRAKKAANDTKLSKIEAGAPEFDVQLLTVNEYSRPGTALEKVKGIVIHYTANPGTGAQAHRN